MTLQQTQEFFHDLCFAKDFSFNEKNLSRYFGIEQTNFLLSQDMERHLIYRTLVEDNIASVLHAAYPVLFSLFEDDPSQKIIRGFLHQHKPLSNIFREIPSDFFNFIKSRAPVLNDWHPAFTELADLEFSEFKLGFEKTIPIVPEFKSELTLANVHVILNPHLILKSFLHPVHNITTQTNLKTFTPSKTHLVICRDPETFDIHRHHLNDTAFHLLLLFKKNPHRKILKILELLPQQINNPDLVPILVDVPFFLKELCDKKIVVALTNKGVNYG